MIVLCLLVAGTAFSQGSGGALRLDGTDDHLSFSKVTVPNGLTFSAWVRISSGSSSSNFTGNPAHTILGDHTDDVQLSFGVDGGVLQYNHLDGTWQQVNGGTTINDGIWHYVAVTHDQSTGDVTLYVDGEVDGTGNIAYGNAAPTQVGVDRIGGGYSNGTDTDDFFFGLLDEIIIFDTPVSQSDIREWMCKTITSSHPNHSDLVAYFQLDEGTGSTTTDVSSAAITADLENGPLWKGSGAAIGDELTFIQSATTSSTLNLAHPNGDDLTVTVSAGTATTIYIYYVDQAPAVTTPPSGLDQLSGSNYFGVRAFGTSGFVYEVEYNYDGHPGITDEANLSLCSRMFNSTSSWTLESATLDVLANTLTLGGQVSTEYILGSSSLNPLPVDLLYFSAKLTAAEQVQLQWSTATEIDNDFFTVERSPDGISWSILEEIPGAGQSTETLEYLTTDRSPLSGTSYYRLKQTDYDGQYSYSDWQVIQLESKHEIGSVTPNPSTGLFYLNTIPAEKEEIYIFNAAGTLIRQFPIDPTNQSIELDLLDQPSGWYFVQVADQSYRIYKQ